MADLWQAYGNWILFALFFIFMIGHHLFMGHGGHGTRRSAVGGVAHGEEHGEGHGEVHREVHGDANPDGHGEGHAHGTGGSAATPRGSRRHSGGCCH